MRICAGLLQVYLRSHMGFSQDIVRPAHQAGYFEQFKMSGMLIQVSPRSPVMAVTVVSPGSSPGQCDCSLQHVHSASLDGPCESWNVQTPAQVMKDVLEASNDVQGSSLKVPTMTYMYTPSLSHFSAPVSENHNVCVT